MKCYKGKLVKWLIGDKTTAYSIHLLGEDDCEAEKFYQRFEDSEYGKDLDLITGIIDNLLARGAFRERYRCEGPVYAIPNPPSNLRMYCLPINNNTIILGNGGIKTSQKSQDSPDCEPYRLFMVAFAAEFQNKIDNEELAWNDSNELIELMRNGLYFEFGDCE